LLVAAFIEREFDPGLKTVNDGGSLVSRIIGKGQRFSEVTLDVGASPTHPTQWVG